MPHGALANDLPVEAMRQAPKKGVDTYAWLRQLWRSWEHGDPQPLENILRQMASNKRRSPSVRAYAGLLSGYARLRRGDLRGAQDRIASLGFVSRWFVVGPFANVNRAGLNRPNPPELELDQPIVLDRAYAGMASTVRWRRSPDVHRFGWLALGDMLRPRRRICGLATTYVRSLRKSARPRSLSLWVGSTGAVKLYMNGGEVLVDDNYRQLDAERQAVMVTLQPGFNRLTAKVCGDQAAPALALRIADAKGQPLSDIEVVASVKASVRAAERLRAQGAVAATKPPRQRVQGPLQIFEARIRKTPKDPELLESFARYLLVTGGDAEGIHRARDMAVAAARTRPTVQRALLASQLAEGRNGRRFWVAKAAGLAQKRSERAQVLLQQARLARTGANWRDAVPIYEKILELQRGNVEAILGRVDMFVEAGLTRTAVATLKQAVAVNPRSVALLRALSGQLRALGRDTEARRIEGRYAALRFDDAGYLKQHLELAVARRNKKQFKHWSQRLIASEPASTWARSTVAQAARRLGMNREAIAHYKGALAIAPEDVTVLQDLAELHGSLGDKAKQRRLLRRVLRIRPQMKSVRSYLEYLEPERDRQDEKYAWTAQQILSQRAITKVSSDDLRVIRKLTVTTVLPSGQASQFKQVAYQPLTKRGATMGRQFVFSYHADRQVVRLRGARVYRKDGRVDETVATGETALNDPSINMYTLQRNYYVQFDKLDVGDVVEVRYRLDDVAVQNQTGDYFGEIQYLQSVDPIVSSEYVLVSPKSKKLHLSHSPLAGLKKTESVAGDKKIVRLIATDVPALRREHRMPPKSELLAQVHVSTFSTWKEVGAWYWGLVKPKLDVDDSVRQRARKLAEKAKTAREKVNAVYAFVAGEIRYVALEFGIEGIRPRRAALTLARGWGDCKDKATLIVSMLRELGVAADLVLLRTGLRGNFQVGTASLAPFDHAIVYVPSLDLYLDGTAEYTGSNELPLMDRGSVGLRIHKGSGTWVRLPRAKAAESSQLLELKMRLDRRTGKLRFAGDWTVKGASAPRWRRRFLTASTQRQRAKAQLASLFGPVRLAAGKGGLSLLNLKDNEQPLRLRLKGTAKALADKAGWSVPMGTALDMVARYAARPSRRHPLLVGAQRELRQVMRLALPANKKVLSTPRSMRLDTPLASFRIDVERGDREVVVTRSLALRKGRIEASEYPAWRRFCRAIDSAGELRVVVER
jgi:cellulose synthase operon protein C